MKNVLKTALLFAMLFATALAHAQYNAGTGSGTNGLEHTFVGVNAGAVNTGSYNTFIGQGAGKLNLAGSYNTFMGRIAGYKNTSGTGNVFLGHGTGYSNTTGRYNTFIGASSGVSTRTGRNNTYLGHQAGKENETGSDNVFLGRHAGYNEMGSDKLYIDNSNTSTPLIHGDFSTNRLTFNATVRIGDVPTPVGYKLYVDDGILTEKVKVATVNSLDWSDYVFAEDYYLNSIEEVEEFVKTNKHLPNVPSAKQVEKNGVDMVEMDATLLRQIEELWLHMIDVKKENEQLKAAVKTLESNK